MVDQETAFQFETLTVSTTVVLLTVPTSTQRGHRVVISCETAQCRFRYDGGSPTATVGHILNPGDRLILEGRANILGFRVIRSGSVDAVLQVTLETI